jgi:hypothetical protein
VDCLGVVIYVFSIARHMFSCAYLGFIIQYRQAGYCIER